MKIISISYPSPLEAVRDKTDDNIDVIIKFDDNSSLCVVVATPDNLKRQMKNESKSFLPPGLPQIIVSQLDDTVIKDAIITYTNDFDFFKKYFID